MQFHTIGGHYNDLMGIESEQDDRLVFEIYEEDEEFKRDDVDKYTFTSIIDKIPASSDS